MSNLSLYKISEEFDALDQLLEMDGGEVTEEYEQLERSAMELMRSKVDGCVEYINREKDLVDLADQKIKELQAFKTARKNKIERFSEYVKMVIDRNEGRPLIGGLNQIKLRKPSKVLVIDDESAVPVEFTKVETKVTIDKAALKKAVKNNDVSDSKIRLEDGKTSVIYGLNTNK